MQYLPIAIAVTLILAAATIAAVKRLRKIDERESIVNSTVSALQEFEKSNRANRRAILSQAKRDRAKAVQGALKGTRQARRTVAKRIADEGLE